MLGGVGLGAGLGGTLSTHSAWARDHEQNPRIHAALNALKDAKEELNDAKTDYHGHKREAQDAVQHAIDQLDKIKDW